MKREALKTRYDRICDSLTTCLLCRLSSTFKEQHTVTHNLQDNSGYTKFNVIKYAEYIVFVRCNKALFTTQTMANLPTSAILSHGLT